MIGMMAINRRTCCLFETNFERAAVIDLDGADLDGLGCRHDLMAHFQAAVGIHNELCIRQIVADFEVDVIVPVIVPEYESVVIDVGSAVSPSSNSFCVTGKPRAVPQCHSR